MHCEPMMTDVDSEGSISTSASSSPGAARTPPDEPQDAEASSEVLKGDDDNLSVASGDKPCCAPDDVDGESSTSSTQRETERQGQGKPEGQLVRTFYTDVTEEINLHFSKTVAAMAAKHFQQQQQQHGRGSTSSDGRLPPYSSGFGCYPAQHYTANTCSTSNIDQFPVPPVSANGGGCYSGYVGAEFEAWQDYNVGAAYPSSNNYFYYPHHRSRIHAHHNNRHTAGGHPHHHHMPHHNRGGTSIVHPEFAQFLVEPEVDLFATTRATDAGLTKLPGHQMQSSGAGSNKTAAAVSPTATAVPSCPSSDPDDLQSPRETLTTDAEFFLTAYSFPTSKQPSSSSCAHDNTTSAQHNILDTTATSTTNITQRAISSKLEDFEDNGSQWGHLDPSAFEGESSSPLFSYLPDDFKNEEMFGFQEYLGIRSDYLQ